MNHRVAAKVRVDRGGFRAPCDLCLIRGKVRPNRGTDLHHIVNKQRTLHNDEARRRSEVPELLSWLCQDCHIGSDNAHNAATDAELLRFNAQIYGREAVEAALAAVSAVLYTPLPIEF